MQNKIFLPESDKALLKECKISSYRASGAGGQHINVTDSAIRLTHLPTGLVVASQKERSQHLNKIECLKKLRKLVEKLNYRPQKRIPTKKPKAAKEEIFQKKAKHSAKKHLRKIPKDLLD